MHQDDQGFKPRVKIAGPERPYRTHLRTDTRSAEHQAFCTLPSRRTHGREPSCNDLHHRYDVGMDGSATDQRHTAATALWAHAARQTVNRPSARQALPAGFDVTALGLPQVFSPAQAAEILRSVGLTEMTECALRTRAYRKQVPFHLNGRRVMFTVDDLREIAEGQPRLQEPRAEAPVPPALSAPPASRRPAQRRSAGHRGDVQPGGWRARRPVVSSTPVGETL